MSTLRHDLANALAPLSLHDDPEVVACVARAMAIVDAHTSDPSCYECGDEHVIVTGVVAIGEGIFQDVTAPCPVCGGGQ